ncbi:MAG: LuxR C-terminal-related transcriptional regulator [Acidimicrobiales bacterium]
MTALEMGLAATKLRPPVPPPSLIRRSRLDDLLDNAVDGGARFLLVSAPAGSGKSTLLASWSASRPGAVAWLQVEERDGDPARFWSYVIQAIALARATAMTDLASVVAGSQGDDVVVVSALVNSLAEPSESLVVVIDDYHLIDHAGIHRGMERLIDLCPERVTIVLATRVDPPFRLGRLRVRHRLAEVRAADLRFDTDETAGLLGSARQPLERELAEQLCGRTEGWAAGLVLAGFSLDRASDRAGFVEAFRGDDQLVVEYLRDELLATLGDDDRHVLLQTSILEQMTGDLVDAITGATGGTTWLRDTARANQLLIGLDHTGTWFRYHHLLRDLLRLEAQHTYPERIAELHARAAAWFAARGDGGQAIVHWLAAGSVDEVAKLLSVEGPRLLAQGQSDTLRDILQELGDTTRTTAWPALLYGWCEFLAGRYDESDRWLDIVAEVAPDSFDLGFAIAPRMNNALARGDVATALAVAREITATDQLVPHSCTRAAAAGAAFAWAGQSDDARRVLRLAVQKALGEGARAVEVNALVHLAVVEFEDGSTAAALAAANTAITTAEAYGLDTYHSVAPAYAIRSRTGADDPRADVGHAIDVARRASTPLVLGYVLAMCGDTCAELGDAAALLLEEARAVMDQLPDPGIAGRYLARVESRHGVNTRSKTRDAPTIDQLTDRELSVLRYLPSKLSQREIASELFVSLNTVKTHCRAIYRKLGVGDRKAAVQAARELNVH